MNNIKHDILTKIGYTDLVYGRINKKLKTNLSTTEIEEMMLALIHATEVTDFQRIGKNIYITNIERNVVLTINATTYRIITVAKLNDKTKPLPRTNQNDH